MSRASEWTNDDGLIVGYGARDTYNSAPAVVHTMGRVKQVEVHIDHSNISEIASGAGTLTGKEAVIPAGSISRSAQLHVTEAFADLTSIVVGGKDTTDGTVDDADGFVASTLLAALTADAIIAGAGAYVGAKLANDVVASLDVTGTAPTAGQAVLLVEYEEPVVDAVAPAVITGEI